MGQCGEGEDRNCEIVNRKQEHTGCAGFALHLSISWCVETWLLGFAWENRRMTAQLIFRLIVVSLIAGVSTGHAQSGDGHFGSPAGKVSVADSIDGLIQSMPRAGEEYDQAGTPLLITQQLRAHIINGELTPKQWADLLIASRIFKHRKRWPDGTPLEVELHRPAWLGTSVEIRATSRLDDRITLSAGQTWSGACGHSNSVIAADEPAPHHLRAYGPVGTLNTGNAGSSTKTVVFDVEIRTGLDRLVMPTSDSLDTQGLYPIASASSTYWAEARVLARAPVKLWVTGIAPEAFRAEFPGEALPDLGASVQTSVYPHSWADGKSRGYVAIWWKRRPEDVNLAMGLIVDLVRDGRVVESLTVPANDWTASTDGALRPMNDVIFETLLDVLPKIGADATELARYQLTVRGDALAARSGWAATRWWAGSFTRPLAACLTNDGTLRRAAK